MQATEKYKSELLKNSLLREKIDFLNMPFHRKVEFIKSYSVFQDGISFKEIQKIVRNVTVFYEKSLARDLEKINNRKKLVYRSSGSIIHRNTNHSKFIIR